MNFTGEKVISNIAKQLKREGKDCHDSDIVITIRNMNRYQFAELATFGELAIWKSNKDDEEKNCHATGIDDLNSVNCKYWCSDKCKFYY